MRARFAIVEQGHMMAHEPIDIAMKVVDNVDVLLGYWDRDLRCQFANSAYLVWFGKSRQEMVGTSMEDLLGPVFESNLPHILAVLRGETQVFERTITLPDGSIRHSLACYYPDISDGEVIGFSVQVADVTRLKNLEFELEAAKNRAEQLATHDFLTGLPNRVLLLDRISTAMANVQRRGGLVGVVAIDVDDFKQINDSHGHETGDAVLKEIASRMKGVVRAEDTVTRLGGDEFIYLAREVKTLSGVQTAIERLREAVCRPVPLQKISLMPSISCGAALYPHHGASATDLLAVADSALYRAKWRGKGCTIFADLGDQAKSPAYPE
ncbi:diguanylate cyclase/phosphodiesterase (GGDEF & EAL domains) with PAS/PAC sensor(s) [Acidisarcina polymorpha]|uniref:Diguanylate cyclase/phosphodiesterase (GGDEF & EAL domains) with PAS/PAC sensor(S) n=1 Tax=Acidisarcina polymorpha TaxID=2211140 RepID=A0A2Z5G4K9_9BACT|nr:GGDEF domain-containing protein [Acidisarcina polymorpha]AXC13456.1 diguanylate cyclase/phosphodiesterase (GGDEF & EAL domains) with PAS/PAC sensor(s) [Acidisarcina polymorpha]